MERSRGAWRSLREALTSRRTASVSLLSFSSGMPLALVWISIPDWMRDQGIDLRIVGLVTLAHAPWTFKVLWSPLLDRYVPPWLGRRRGWILVAQVALFVATLCLAGVGADPDAPYVVIALAFAIAFASATQDIAVDAYAVDVLRKDEQAIAVGARTAVYRAAMYVAGALAITLTTWISWPMVNLLLALLYLPMMLVTLRAPEPTLAIAPPPSLREAIWLPFLGFLSRHRALEILAFVVFYKLADNLAQSLQRPFLNDMGYDAIDRGLALGTVGLIGTMVGTFVGGALTTWMGLGRSLWLFGLLQIFSNLGFVWVSQSEVDRPLMYGAMAFETLTTGLGMGAFGVLLLRMTQRRFSVTQYALFSSLFGLPRLAAGPITGFTVDALGWTAFFWITLLAGIPGLLLLARFVPPGVREPRFEVRPPLSLQPLSKAQLWLRGMLGGAGTLLFAVAIQSLLARLTSAEGSAAWLTADFTGGLRALGTLIFALAGGLMTAAVFAARHGAALETDGD